MNPSLYKKSDIVLPAIAVLLFIGAIFYGVIFGFDILLVTVIGLMIVISILRNIKFGILLLTCSFFFVRPLFYLPFSNLTYIRVDDIIWILVLVSWFIGKYRFNFSLPLAKPLALFVSVAVLSIFRTATLTQESLAIQNTAWFLIRLIQYVSVYFIVGSLNLTDKSRNNLFTAILFCGAIVAAIGLFQYADMLPRFASTAYVAAEGPLTATFTFKAHIGAVMMILIILTIDKLSRNSLNKLAGFSLIILFSIVMMLTQSRSAWVATFLGVAFYMGMLKQLRLKVFWAIALVLILIVMSNIVDLKQLYQNRAIFDLDTGQIAQDAAVSTRLSGYVGSLSTFLESPGIFLFGVGFLNWRYALYASSLLYNGHNNYITALGELGVFGFLVFFNIWITAIRCSWKEIQARQPFALFYLSMVIALLFAALTEDIFWPNVALESFLAFLMLLSALSLHTKKLPATSLKPNLKTTKENSPISYK